MSETTYIDFWERRIVFAEYVRNLILLKHPETALLMSRIESVLSAPDEVRISTHDERSILYYQYHEDVFGGKWLVVVVKQIDRNFISTFYITDQIKSGSVLWKK